MSYTGKMRVANIKIDTLGLLSSWRHEIQQETVDGDGNRIWQAVPVVGMSEVDGNVPILQD